MDFVVDVGGRLELLDAKWTELPAESDAVNLAFVRGVVGKASVSGGSLVCRTPSSYPLGDGLRATSVVELE